MRRPASRSWSPARATRSSAAASESRPAEAGLAPVLESAAAIATLTTVIAMIHLPLLIMSSLLPDEGRVALLHFTTRQVPTPIPDLASYEGDDIAGAGGCAARL